VFFFRYARRPTPRGRYRGLLLYALMEFQGELAPWLVSIGIAAVGTVWAKVWLELESQRPARQR
jgi:hypothetical protein